MRALLFALVAAGSLELYYGATAADTIGGLNWFATVLALGTGGFGLVLAALLAFRRALRATALVLALLLHAALIAGALAVLATREFHAGYGP